MIGCENVESINTSITRGERSRIFGLMFLIWTMCSYHMSHTLGMLGHTTRDDEYLITMSWVIFRCKGG